MLEKTLKEIEKMCFTAELYEHGWDGETVNNLLCFGDVKEVLENHMNDRWIPVEERLPEEYADIEHCAVSDLVQCTVYDAEKDEYFVCDDCTANGKWCNFEETTGRLKVIAWQPLPEPYKAEKEK